MAQEILKLEVQQREVDKPLFRLKDQFLEKLRENYDEGNFDSKMCMSIGTNNIHLYLTKTVKVSLDFIHIKKTVLQSNKNFESC